MEYNKEEIIKEFKDWSKFRVQGVWKDSIEKLLIEFIEQRLVKKLTIPAVVGQSEQFNCFLEDSEQSERCETKCKDCKDYKGVSN